MSAIVIQPASLADWPAIESIYRAGIRTGQATFNTEADVPDGPAWFASKLPGMVFKAVDESGRLRGWSALSPTSSRRVYAGVVEVSVYVDPAAFGQGIGSQLLAQLVTAAEAAGMWTLVAAIFPENEASVRLHLKHGFRILGRRERVARQDGVWRDVLLLERRSTIVGL